MLLGSRRVLHGTGGQVKYSYRTAVLLSTYQVIRDQETKVLTLVGTAATCDQVLLRERPLVFVVAGPKGALKFPVESCAVDGQQFTARLGKPS